MNVYFAKPLLDERVLAQDVDSSLAAVALRQREWVRQESTSAIESEPHQHPSSSMSEQLQSLRADAARRRQQERESQRGTPMPSPTPSEADVQSLRSAASSRRSNISRMSQRVGEETARSEQLESALSEYLRPTDLEDAEQRENEDPNMYYETLSGKSVMEENIEKNMKSSKTSHKEKH